MPQATKKKDDPNRSMTPYPMVNSQEYMAPGSRSPSRERSPVRPVLNAYFTQKFRPKQVYGPRPSPQVTPLTLVERSKRKEEEVERDQTRGRQKKQDQGSSGSHDQVSSGRQDQEPSRRVGCREQGAPGHIGPGMDL